jgi:uncharacterized membrane protein
MAQEQSTNVKLIDIGTDAEKILKTLLKGIKDIDTGIQRGNDANEDNARRTRETQRNEAVRSEIAQRRQSAAQAAVHGEIRKGSTLLVGIKNVIGTIKDYVKDVSKRTIKSFDSLAQAQRKLLMSSEDIKNNQLAATKQQGILKDKNIRINRDDIGKITTSLAEETGTRFHELSEAQQSVLTVAMAKNKLSAQEALNLAMTVNEKNQDDILKTLIKGTDLTGQAVFKKTLQAQSEAWFKAYANQKGGTEVALKQMQESGQKLDALLGAQSVTAEDQFELLETLAKLQTGQLERTREESIKSILAIAGGDNEVLRDPSKLADVIERGIKNNKFTDENLRVLGDALGGENSSIAKGLATLNASYKQTGEIFKKSIETDDKRADAINVANEGGIFGNFIDTAITSFDEFTGGWFSRASTAINEWFGEDLSLEKTVSFGFEKVTFLLKEIIASNLFSGAFSGGIGALGKFTGKFGDFFKNFGSKITGGISKFAKFVPVLTLAVGTIGAATNAIKEYNKNTPADKVGGFSKEVTKTFKDQKTRAAVTALTKGALTTGTALAGAKIGAAIGSAAPGIGTIIGSVVGGAVGLAASSVIDNWQKGKTIEENIKIAADLNAEISKLQNLYDIAKKHGNETLAKQIADEISQKTLQVEAVEEQINKDTLDKLNRGVKKFFDAQERAKVDAANINKAILEKRNIISQYENELKKEDISEEDRKKYEDQIAADRKEIENYNRELKITIATMSMMASQAKNNHLLGQRDYDEAREWVTSHAKYGEKTWFSDKQVAENYKNNVDDLIKSNEDLARLQRTNSSIIRNTNKATDDLVNFLNNSILKKMAFGGVVNTPTPALVGEAGKEVILPLTKPGIIGKILSNLSSNEKRSLLSALLGIKNLSSENIFSNIISLLKNNKSPSAAQPRQNVLSSLPANAVPGDDPATIQKILSMAGPYSDLVYNNLLHGYKGNYKDGFKQRKKWYDEALVNAANQEGRDMIRGTYAERALDYGVSELGKPYILRALGKIGYVCNELVNACIQASGFDMGKFRINGVGATFRNINSGKMSGKGYPNFRIRNDLTPQTAMPGMLFFQDSRKNKEGGFQPGHIGLVYYGHQKLHASGGASSYKTSTFLRDWQTPCRGVTVTPFDNKSYVIGELPGLFEKANGEFSLPKNAQSIFGPVDISKDTTNVNKAINNAGLLSNEEINAILNEAGKSNSITMQQYITQAKDLMNSSNKNDVIAILTEIARYIKGIAIATKPKAVAVGKPPASVFGI